MITKDIQYLILKYPHYGKDIKQNFKLNFVLLAFDSAFFTFSTSLLSQDTILPAFISQLSSSSVLIGLIPALFYLGYFLPQIISSYFTQTRTRRKGMILGIAIAERIGILLIALTSQAIFQFSNTIILTLFFFSYALFTSTTGLIIPAYSDFISKAIYKKRGLFFGLTQAMGGIIGFCASLAATRILSNYEFPKNFQFIFWLSFAFSFISPFIISKFKEAEFPILPKKVSILDFIKFIPRIMHNHPNLGKYIISRHLIGLAMMGNSFFIIYAIKQFHLGSGVVGVFTMVILLSQSISGLVWGQIGDKFGYQIILSASSLLLVAQGIIAMLAKDQSGFFIIAGLVGCMYSAIYICHSNIIFILAPPEDTSLFIGLSNTLIAPVLTLAPILGGMIIDLFGYRSLFATITVIAILATVISTYVFREPRDG